MAGETRATPPPDGPRQAPRPAQRSAPRGGWRRALGAGLSLALTVAVAACGGGGDDETSSGGNGGGGGEPQPGGTLTYITHAEAQSLDPVFISNAAGGLAGGTRAVQIYDVLVYQDTESNEVRPRLAESLETTDGRVWTLKLREGVEFTDGTPLDAEAVKFNWERALDPELSSPIAAAVSQIETMEAADPLTLEITLVEPNAQFDRTVARVLPFIGSPTAIQEMGEEFGQNPVGAGPFKVREWVRDDHITFERNPDYWNAPRPYLDELVFRVIVDETQAWNSFSAGEADVMHSSAGTTVTLAEDAGIPMLRESDNGGTDLRFNVTRPPFDDERVRRAIALAIDLDQMSEVVDDGNGVTAQHLFEEGSPFYQDIPMSEHDPEEARRLFDEYVDETGEPLEFGVNTFDTTRVRSMVEYMQTQLAEYDVTMNMEAASQTEAAQRAFSHDFQATIYGTSFLDCDGLYDNFVTDGRTNHGEYSSEELDAALHTIRTSTDEAERVEACTEAQEILAEDVPTVFLLRTDTHIPYREGVEGLETFEQRNLFFDGAWLAS